MGGLRRARLRRRFGPLSPRGDGMRGGCSPGDFLSRCQAPKRSVRLRRPGHFSLLVQREVTKRKDTPRRRPACRRVPCGARRRQAARQLGHPWPRTVWLSPAAGSAPRRRRGDTDQKRARRPLLARKPLCGLPSFVLSVAKWSRRTAAPRSAVLRKAGALDPSAEGAKRWRSSQAPAPHPTLSSEGRRGKRKRRPEAAFGDSFLIRPIIWLDPRSSARCSSPARRSATACRPWAA